MAIDLRSDTVTKPTPAMRRAMAEAEVGDDVLDGDPTVSRLERRVAELLGKESALFFPTGTMANQAAVWILSRPGTEVLLDAAAHIIQYEQAGAAALCGVQLRPVQGSGPMMDAEALEQAFRLRPSDLPAVSAVCIENTHNHAGGRATPMGELGQLRAAAGRRGVPVHMDGARLWNAAATLSTPLDRLASCADTVMVSFSKGLGAPVGAALAARRDLIDEARIARRRFGGGMRQSGILAAAALYGIEKHMGRLPEDHARARAFAKAVEGAGGVRVVPPDTNIVMLDLPSSMDSADVVREAAAAGVLLSLWSPSRIRAVFHLDVDDAMLAQASAKVGRALDSVAAGRAGALLG